MSSIETDLFAPIDTVPQIEEWRSICRKVVAQLQEEYDKLRPKRPKGSLLLEDLFECFFQTGQTVYWSVDDLDGAIEFHFNGSLFVDDEGVVTVNDPDGDPVLDYNLFPPCNHSQCYIFSDHALAEAYETVLLGDDI